jgi:hypothetical protein
MIRVNVSVSPSRRRTRTSRITRELNKLPSDAYKYFRSITPKRSGNARNKTMLRGRSIIAANYPYAKRLDEGYSKQAPRGMVQPTLEWIRNRIKTIFRI